MYLTWANRITITRILLIVPFIILMLKIHDQPSGDIYRYAAFALFVFMAVSDGIDGYIARSRNQVTKLGSFLDPLGDKVLMVSALLLLSSESAHIQGFRLPIWIVVTILAKEVLTVAGFIITYFMTTQIRIVPVYIGKFATAVQFIMVAGILIGPELSAIWSWWHGFIRLVWITAGITAILAALVYIRNGMRYIEEFDQQLQKHIS